MFKMNLEREKRKTDSDVLEFIDKKMTPEPEVVDAMIRILRPGDLAIDGGANVGFFSLLMAQLVGPEGSVIAYEPVPANVEALRANLALNEVENVTVDLRPLWSEAGKVPMSVFADNGIGAIGNHPDAVEVVETETTHLDDQMEWHGVPVFKYGMPRLIKLDIEGSEQKALEGARDMLLAGVSFVIAELNEEALAKQGDSQQSLRAFMHGLNYAAFLLLSDAEIPIYLHPGVKVISTMPNVYLLFSTREEVAKAWPEVHVGCVT